MTQLEQEQMLQPEAVVDSYEVIDGQDGVDEGVTKRLSFGEMSQQLNTTQQIDPDEVIKALKNPSTGNFIKAIHMLKDACNVRSNTIQETAKEQSVSVGEADLRRMKRQFSSLKNTFLHYEVKDEFIAALADGLPNGTEDIQLAQFEEEANRNIQLLRELKSRNLQKQEEISGLIDQVDAGMKEVSQSSAATLSAMLELQSELEAFEQEIGQLDVEIPPGMTEEECEHAIAEEAVRASELEAELVSITGEIQQLEAHVPTERQELEAAREILADLRIQEKEAGSREDIARESQRYSASSAWASEVTLLLESLSGVSSVRYTDGRLEMMLQTQYPNESMIGSATIKSCSSAEHSVQLFLNADNGLVTGGKVLPLDVDVSSIIRSFETAHRVPTVDFVMNELRSRIAGLYHRKVLVEEAKKLFGDVTSDAEAWETIFQVPNHYKTSVHVKARMRSCWPDGDDCVCIENIIGESSLVGATVRCKERLYGSYVDAFQAVIHDMKDV